MVIALSQRKRDRVEIAYLSLAILGLSIALIGIVYQFLYPITVDNPFFIITSIFLVLGSFFSMIYSLHRRERISKLKRETEKPIP